jgi:DNA-binding NarL/FixJ family response regulator
LLVEPSPILQSVLRKWLQDILDQPRVLIAANGADALRLAAQDAPSHVLIEIKLPDRMGLEVLNELRGDLPEARIVATGWSDNSFLLDRISSTGADGYVIRDKLASELFPLWQISTE